ncbi:hypothetical protein GWI33_011100 [Rhynchophorus ferrugineus]|uniref:Uncharacterized protein n=1 Tax=Rhynchophorus ferrugineus TaxID=354439 RepID=A0A834IUI5_RHYFE|nr:hypothetical protein GWI33_011100 [Rhynchophorus ferrugineus]
MLRQFFPSSKTTKVPFLPLYRKATSIEPIQIHPLHPDSICSPPQSPFVFLRAGRQSGLQLCAARSPERVPTAAAPAPAFPPRSLGCGCRRRVTAVGGGGEGEGCDTAPRVCSSSYAGYGRASKLKLPVAKFN